MSKTSDALRLAKEALERDRLMPDRCSCAGTWYWTGNGYLIGYFHAEACPRKRALAAIDEAMEE